MNSVSLNRSVQILVAAVAIAAISSPITAQRQGVSNGDWCLSDNWGDDREGVCEVREFTVPAAGATMTVDAAPNGGIAVEGSSRSDIVVQARVVATAASQDTPIAGQSGEAKRSSSQ